jgi:serine-type D-Ala-D-Ala carboxypeptidase
MQIEAQIISRLERALQEKVFPGCVLGIVSKNGERWVKAFGKLTYKSDAPLVEENTIYDVASVTKAVAGAASLLYLIDQGKLSVDDPVVKFIPEFGTDEEKKKVSIKHILSYTLDLDVPSMSALKDKSSEEIIAIVLSAPLKSSPGTRYFYTNSTALFISLIVEKITGEKLDVFATEHFYKPLGMDRTTFHPLDSFSENDIAPSEIVDWRGGEVRGLVHDESSYALSKKSPVAIAGLFSTVPDLLTFEEMLLNEGRYKDKKIFSAAIVHEIYINQFTGLDSDTGLGFELNQKWFMGEKASNKAFGKTGFTGCHIVLDPEKGIGFVLLSNWAYPKRQERGENSPLNVLRRDLADLIF